MHLPADPELMVGPQGNHCPTVAFLVQSVVAWTWLVFWQVAQVASADCTVTRCCCANTPRVFIYSRKCSGPRWHTATANKDYLMAMPGSKVQTHVTQTVTS